MKERMSVAFYHGTDENGFIGIGSKLVIKKGCITPVKKYAKSYAKPYLFKTYIQMNTRFYLRHLLWHYINLFLNKILGDYMEYFDYTHKSTDLYSLTIDLEESNIKLQDAWLILPKKSNK